MSSSGTASSDTVIIRLWLHREMADAWLVSREGIGAGEWLPKSLIALEAGHPLPVLGPVGPVDIALPIWLAIEKRLRDRPDPDQPTLL